MNLFVEKKRRRPATVNDRSARLMWVLGPCTRRRWTIEVVGGRWCGMLAVIRQVLRD